MAEFPETYLGLALSADELVELVDWPPSLVEDYTSITNSLQQMSSLIVSNRMIVGTGSPSGSVTSNHSRQYLDSGGAEGARFWVNSLVGVKVGWIAIS